MTTKRKPRSRRDIMLSYDLTKTWIPMLKAKKKKGKKRGKKKPSK